MGKVQGGAESPRFVIETLRRGICHVLNCPET
jgi:hypothetical protein